MKKIRFELSNPHYGDPVKNLNTMPFADLVSGETGETVAQLYLFRYNLLQVSHPNSDSSSSAGSTWSSIYFDGYKEQLKNADYDTALCIMKLLIILALENQSGRECRIFDKKRNGFEFPKMVFSRILQDYEPINRFARMCLEAYRAHH